MASPTIRGHHDAWVDSASPRARLAVRYLDAVLARDRDAAVRGIVDAAAAGVPIDELYLQVFVPVQREIGRRWEQEGLPIGTEHYCTAVTQHTISQLYPYVFSSERNGLRLVATAARGELHELAPRMVSDLFELSGWDTHYLGASTSHADVLDAIADRDADLLVASASLHAHVASVAELVAATRADPRTAAVKVLVGGRPFTHDPGLCDAVGADGTAADGVLAVRLGAALVGGRR